MKNLHVLLLLVLSVFSFSAFAAVDVSVIMGFLGPMIPEYIEKYPILGDILGFMAISRMVIKPVMSALLTVYKDTSFGFLSFSESILENKIYKTVAFVLDYVVSLKLPKKK